MRRLAPSVSALLLAALLVPALLAPVAASPQPTPACSVCGSVFEAGAHDRGANVTVENSTVAVRIHGNGSATWTVRNRLGRGADAFRDEETSLTTVAERLLDRSYGLPDESATLRSASTDGDVAILRFRDPDAGTRRAGLLVVDYFRDGGYEPWYHVNADRFEIRGPEGTVVTNDPESGGVDGRRVTWRGSVAGELYDAPALDGSPYVVFGPDRSPETRTRTTLALAGATLPVVVRSVRSYLIYQTALFAVVLAAVAAALRTRPPGGVPERWAGAVAALGALGAVPLAVRSGPPWILGPPLFGAAVGLAVVRPRTRRRLGTPRGQALAAAGALAATFAVLAGLDAFAAGLSTVDLPAALRFTAVALPVAAMLPLGGALAGSRTRLVGWWGLAVVAFAAVPAATVDFADPPSGLGGGLVAAALFGLAVVAPLVGAFALALGRALAVEDGLAES